MDLRWEAIFARADRRVPHGDLQEAMPVGMTLGQVNTANRLLQKIRA
jgi:hypothetical protein